jgi:hypothetical protein
MSTANFSLMVKLCAVVLWENLTDDVNCLSFHKCSAQNVHESVTVESYGMNKTLLSFS